MTQSEAEPETSQEQSKDLPKKSDRQGNTDKASKHAVESFLEFGSDNSFKESISSEKVSRLSKFVERYPSSKKIPIIGGMYTSEKNREEAKHRMDRLKNEININEHLLDAEQFAEKMDTHLYDGLTNAQAEERLQIHGLNKLTPPEKESMFKKLLMHLFGSFATLLWVGGILCMIVHFINTDQVDKTNDNLILGIVLFSVVIITGLFSFYQDYKSEKVMQCFENMMPSMCDVIRGGVKEHIPVEFLVPGDLVSLKGGDLVPADMRVITSSNIKVDNSTLTGETEPQSRSPKATHSNPMETKNLMYFSTNVLEGKGTGVVILTGDNTAMGRIASLTGSIKDKKSTLQQDVDKFTFIISVISIAVGLGLMFSSFAVGYTVIEGIVFFIGCLVAMVPEGLLATLAVSLTLSGKRLAERNCLVKSLTCIETLGATSCICSDKTGTLTQNRMTVTHYWFDGDIHVAENLPRTTYPPERSWDVLADASKCCMKAAFNPGQDDLPVFKRTVNGDASETAILKFFEYLDTNVMDYRQKYPKVFEIPFNSTDKVHLTINKHSDELTLYLKGAPERVLGVCTHILEKNKKIPLVDDHKQAYDRAYRSLALRGQRVLGYAALKLPNDAYPVSTKFSIEQKNYPSSGYTFLGLVGLVDPPRASVPSSIEKCRNAGIQVIMVTGDHPLTARAIAKAVGILTQPTVEDIAERNNIAIESVDAKSCKAAVIHGEDLNVMNKRSLDNFMKNHKEIVFARTSPQQKLLIVESCQRLGKVVAVTGDGVNDSPALKQAHIGVAMGICGSEVSKQVAKVVLLDDNFSSIVNGVEQGRLIYDNLKKSICYTLSSKTPELTPFVVYLSFGLPLALSTIGILCIDLGTDLLPAIFLAYEFPESDIMNRAPRNIQTEKLVTRNLMIIAYTVHGVFLAATGFVVYFTIMATNGFFPRALMGIRQNWINYDIIIKDSFGQEWSGEARKRLTCTSNSGYFLTVVMLHWIEGIICKTRRLSLFQHKMRNNHLNFAIFFETTFALFITYVPVVNDSLQYRTLPVYYLFIPLPFLILLFFIDEGRKYIIRNKPKSQFTTEFVY